MDFRKEFKIEPFDLSITYKDRLFFLGSCFAENISTYFENYKFQVSKNPFGIIYSPSAIERIIEIAIDQTDLPEKNSFKHNDLWSSFDSHSSLSHHDKDNHIQNLRNARLRTRDALQSSQVIFISLGTAWVYKDKVSQNYVANCHKLPQRNFHKELLNLETTTSILKRIIDKISALNKDIKIVFTLSPVRHLKDGFIENQQSKSILHLAIQESLSVGKNVFYFPSYEILLDDLRDYRFYASDFLHPNELALNYIWDKLIIAFFDEGTTRDLIKVEKIKKRLAHRFFNPESKDSQSFKRKTEQQIEELIKHYPHIKF
jgi:hypothetical protein